MDTQKQLNRASLEFRAEGESAPGLCELYSGFNYHFSIGVIGIQRIDLRVNLLRADTFSNATHIHTKKKKTRKHVIIIAECVNYVEIRFSTDPRGTTHDSRTFFQRTIVRFAGFVFMIL
jgi:hypothetical protein